MVIQNKRAWLRIFEAVIAIILVMGAVLLIYSNQRQTVEEDRYIQDWQREILSRLAENETLRNSIINNETSNIESFIESNKLQNINFSIKICEINSVCLMDYYIDSDVFVQERIISGTIEQYNPKKIRFFVWKKEAGLISPLPEVEYPEESNPENSDEGSSEETPSPPEEDEIICDIWTEWGECSSSCGGGTRNQTDNCGNINFEECNIEPCESIGLWTNWQSFGSSDPCLINIELRTEWFATSCDKYSGGDKGNGIGCEENTKKGCRNILGSWNRICVIEESSPYCA